MNADLGDMIKRIESDCGPKAKKRSGYSLVAGVAVMILAIMLESILHDGEILAFMCALGAVCILVGIVGMIIFSRKSQLEIRTKGILIINGGSRFSLLYKEMQIPEISSSNSITQVHFKNAYNATGRFIVKDVEEANEICQLIKQARDERLAQL